MCFFEFQYSQDTAPGRRSCAAVAHLAGAHVWRGRGARGGSSAPPPGTAWTPRMARLEWSQNEEQGLDHFSCDC